MPRRAAVFRAFAVEDDERFAAGFAPHFDVEPAERCADAGAEGLGHGLFRGEALRRPRSCLEGERAYCGKTTRVLRERFAAKEAVSKAFGTGIGASLGWLDIEVRRKASGEPFIVLHGEGAKTAARLGITEIRLSLSHSDHYSVAHALALGA